MGFKVLLLEADELLRRQLGDALVERACEVVTVADAAEGVTAAASQRFDLILASPEIGERIKADPASAGLPLVVMASTPARPSLSPSAPSRDLRETLKAQERTVTSLRADLAARSGVIDRLTTKCKELTQRLAEMQTILDAERRENGGAVAELAAMKEAHAVELRERDRAHAEETAFLERAHEEASDASARRLRESEEKLVAARVAQGNEAELVETLRSERDAALRERDDARILCETNAMDLAQARMDLAEETRARVAEREESARRIAELEAALARTESFGTELATLNAKLADAARALEAAERDAIQQQLARDAAFHDLSYRAAADLRAAVEAAKREAAAERDELVRLHEHAIKLATDKAIAQALAVARERKKQT